MELEPMFSISAAAKLIGVHPHTVRDWDAKGIIECSRTPGGHRRISMSEIRRMREERTEDA
jgi:excisionase family DNA binding protein